MIIGGTLGAIGDCICQNFMQGEEHQYDKKRNAVICSYGFLEVGLEAAVWYPFLDKIFGSCLIRSVAIKKVLADQFGYSPVEMLVFMRWTNYFNGKEEFTQKIERDYIPAAVTNLCFWIPVGYVCFVFVPLKHRAVYAAACQVVWDAFMSYASHNNLRETLEKLLNRTKIIQNQSVVVRD